MQEKSEKVQSAGPSGRSSHYLPTTSGTAVITWSPDQPSALEIPVIPPG